MEKIKKAKGAKISKQHMTFMVIVASDGSFVFEKLLSGDKKNNGVLSPLKIHGDQCLCTIFPIKNLGWTQTSWRVFCRDLTVNCA